MKFNTEVVMRLLGLLMLMNTDITYEDYEGLSSIIVKSMGFSLIGFALVRYLFDRKEYAALQAVVHNIDKMSAEEIKSFNVEQAEIIRNKRRVRNFMRSKLRRSATTVPDEPLMMSMSDLDKV